MQLELTNYSRGWKKLPLMKICNPKQWPTISMAQLTLEGYPVYGANGIIGSYPEYNHDESTILITCRGATCGEMLISSGKCWVNGNAMALDNLATNVAHLRWLFYSLKHRGFKDVISGSAQPQITRSDLASVYIPLPPLAEQERIAARLDLLLGRLKTARKRLDAVPELLKRFRKSVLAMAVSGRLTEEWRAEHADELPSAEELLAQVRKERREAWENAELEKMRAKGKVPKDEGWKNRYESAVTISSTLYDTSPCTWVTISFDAACWEITVGFVGTMAEHYIPCGVPMLRSLNVRAFRVDFDDIKYISEKFHIQIQKSILRPGDLVTVRTGDPGTTAVVPNKFSMMNCSDLIISRLLPSLLPRFASIVMNSQASKAHVSANQVGVAQQHFNIGSMKAHPLPLPALPEQHEIVRRVDELFAYADALEVRVAQARKMAERLEPSLLAKAFRGELSEQIPEEAAAWEKTLAELEAAAGALGEKVAKRGRKPRVQVEEGTEWAVPKETDSQPLKRKRGRPRKVP